MALYLSVANKELNVCPLLLFIENNGDFTTPTNCYCLTTLMEHIKQYKINYEMKACKIKIDFFLGPFTAKTVYLSQSS